MIKKPDKKPLAMTKKEWSILLRTDVKAFNDLRRENPDKRINLSGFDFSWLNLSGANLSRVDLYNTYFYGADLSGANLTYSIVKEANFSNADLTDADLSWAISHQATFCDAVLKRTKITHKGRVAYVSITMRKPKARKES